MRSYSKIIVFFLSLWPIYLITYQIVFNQLGPEPVDRIINHFGEWTLIFIFLTLSMTPLRKITKSLEWIKFRRMLGLFAFFYASIHMLSYVGLDYRFDFEPLVNDVLKKKFIFIGFSAWLLLIPLAVWTLKLESDMASSCKTAEFGYQKTPCSRDDVSARVISGLSLLGRQLIRRIPSCMHSLIRPPAAGLGSTNV